MDIDVADYSTAEFNALLDYGDAFPRFDSLGGNVFAKGVMEDLFRRHKVAAIVLAF